MNSSFLASKGNYITLPFCVSVLPTEIGLLRNDLLVQVNVLSDKLFKRKPLKSSVDILLFSFQGS